MLGDALCQSCPAAVQLDRGGLNSSLASASLLLYIKLIDSRPYPQSDRRYFSSNGGRKDVGFPKVQRSPCRQVAESQWLTHPARAIESSSMATQPVISPSSPDQTAVSTPTVTAEPERIETPVSAQDPSAVSFSLPTKSSTTPAAPSRDDPRFSFASTRYSTTSSIFSVRPISTASTALTRGSSVRQSSLDSEPFSAISPWENEQRKDSFDASHRYFCTSCNSTFDSKGAWKEHQVASHGASHPCYPCGIRFEDGRSLVEHLSITHSFPPLDSDGFRPRLSLTSVKRWGCGFCDTSPLSLPSHSDYLDHVGTHMDEGRERVQWQRQTVIKALLQTPVLKEAWQGVVKRQEVVRGSKLRFSWDDQTCLLLQRLLECFDGDNNSAEQLAETVLRAAEVKVAENIKGTYTTDGLSSHIPSSLAAHSGPVKQTGADVPATPENPDNGQPSVTSTPRIARPPSPSPRIVGPSVPPFGSFLSHVAVGPEHFATLSPRVLAKIQETLPAQQSPPTQPDPRRLQPAPVARHPARQGTLRRIESDWDLGLSRLSQIRENEPTVPRPQTSLAFRPIQNPVLDIPEDNGSHLGQPSPQTPGDRSPTSHAPSEEWLIPSIGYPRGPPSGSSLLSIHTMDHSRSIETSDCETISEPESWLDLNERPDLRLCVKEYYRRVGRVMGHLWVCYNRDWDALITQCVGEQSSSNYAPSRESRGQTGSANTQLSTYSLQPHRLPAGDREDDDEMDELRPNSSQSKRGSGSLKRFACPFRKRFPTIYSHSVPEHEICALRSWDSVSRMK